MNVIARRAAAALAVAAAAFALLPVLPAAAGNNGSFAVGPTSAPDSAIPRQYFAYSLPAGQQVQDSVTIENLTQAPKTFLIYGADGYTTPRDGALGFATRTAAQHSVGSWITLATGRVTVPAQTSAVVPFTLRVPDGAAPGDHAGGVVVLDTAISAGNGSSGGVSIGVQQAIAARVYLRVAGPLHPGLRVQDVHLDRGGKVPVIRYTLRNTGNVRLTPSTEVAVTGMLGGSISTVAQQLPGDLLPGASAQYTAPLKAGLPFADYLTVRVAASAGGANASASVRELLLPWQLPVGAVVLLAAMVAGLLLRRRRRARPADAPPLPEPEPAAAP